MSAEWNLAALLNLIAQEAATLLVADRASIFLLDKEKSELWSQVTLGSPPIRFDARLGLAGAAALTRQVINVKDAHEDPRFYKEVDTRTGFVLAACWRCRCGITRERSSGRFKC